MACGTRDLCQIVEEAPHCLRSKSLDFSSHSRWVIRVNMCLVAYGGVGRSRTHPSVVSIDDRQSYDS